MGLCTGPPTRDPALVQRRSRTSRSRPAAAAIPPSMPSAASRATTMRAYSRPSGPVPVFGAPIPSPPTTPAGDVATGDAAAGGAVGALVGSDVAATSNNRFAQRAVGVACTIVRVHGLGDRQGRRLGRGALHDARRHHDQGEDQAQQRPRYPCVRLHRNASWMDAAAVPTRPVRGRPPLGRTQTRSTGGPIILRAAAARQGGIGYNL